MSQNIIKLFRMFKEVIMFGEIGKCIVFKQNHLLFHNCFPTVRALLIFVATCLTFSLDLRVISIFTIIPKAAFIRCLNSEWTTDAMLFALDIFGQHSFKSERNEAH